MYKGEIENKKKKKIHSNWYGEGRDAIRLRGVCCTVYSIIKAIFHFDKAASKWPSCVQISRPRQNSSSVAPLRALSPSVHIVGACSRESLPHMPSPPPRPEAERVDGCKPPSVGTEPLVRVGRQPSPQWPQSDRILLLL